MNQLQNNRLYVGLLTIALIGLLSGLGLSMADRSDLERFAWNACFFPFLVALQFEIVRSLAKG